MSANSDPAHTRGHDAPDSNYSSTDPDGHNVTRPAAPNPAAALQVDVRFHS
jgi:hypothetical protein